MKIIYFKKVGKKLLSSCPFHEEKTPSFTVDPDKERYHCFGCKADGTTLELIKMGFDLWMPGNP